ncbi:MAG TPA: lamin tail domain-containing protein [Nitrososphaera sp.]|nr:lamin tail domain-containing protein [Nitrososphaera sp.]
MSTSKSGPVTTTMGLLLVGLVAVGGIGSMSLVESVYAQPAASSSSSSNTNSDVWIIINEVESNPPGGDNKGEWVELYNPTSSDIPIGSFKLKTSFMPSTISIPASAKIDAGRFYVIAISGSKLSNSAESLSLVDGSGRIVDRTPFLVDRSNDLRTWQRVPDGAGEWKFQEQTKGASNAPAVKPVSSSQASGGNNNNNNNDQRPAATCSNSCIQGIALRMADPDILYVQVDKDTYKVDLSLVKAPARSDKNYFRAASYTRNLCLGSSVMIDEDAGQNTTSNGKNVLVGVAYCSSHNLNQELLDIGYVQIDKKQCGTSEFSSQDWARRNGC